jgi:hypothetical protein
MYYVASDPVTRSNMALTGSTLNLYATIPFPDFISMTGMSEKEALFESVSCRCMKLELVLVATKETVLQGMADRIIEIGRCCGMEMNVGKKTEILRI